ncbi:hypothetical protein TNCV_944631 [Trichonephila clavipes]|nr:hypothetical protein TNCV_944631 [Trichonephila clavipes]
MPTIYGTISSVNTYGCQSRVNGVRDTLWTFRSVANGVKRYEGTPNDAYKNESVVIWFVMELDDSSLS